MIKFLSIFSLIAIIYSCGQSESQSANPKELEQLRNENTKLREELDSLHSILENETIELVAFNGSHGKVLNENDSVEFLFGMLYNRPNYATTFYVDIFTNKDSLTFAQDDPENYSFMYEVDMTGEESIASIPLEFPYLKSEFCVIGGVMRVQTATTTKYFKLQYDMNLNN
jgi:hypothetical protein